jgi:hypothetical protein
MRRTCDVTAVSWFVAATGEQIPGEWWNDNTFCITSTTVQWDGVTNYLSEDLLVTYNHIPSKVVFTTLPERQCMCSVKLFEAERGVTLKVKDEQIVGV